MTTTNAFIFSWDQYGIESIIPISQYEHHDQQNLIKLLKGESKTRNPLDTIVRNLILRARVNGQRHYEIYAIDCEKELDQKFWEEQWTKYPQETADLIRERGHPLYKSTRSKEKVLIT